MFICSLCAQRHQGCRTGRGGALATTHLNFLLGYTLANLSRFLGREVNAVPQVSTTPRVITTKHATFIIPRTSPYFDDPESLVKQYAIQRKPKHTPKHALPVSPIDMELDQPKQPKTTKSTNPFADLEVDPLPSYKPKPKPIPPPSSLSPSPSPSPLKRDKSVQVGHSTRSIDRASQACPETKEVEVQTRMASCMNRTVAMFSESRFTTTLPPPSPFTLPPSPPPPSTTTTTTTTSSPPSTANITQGTKRPNIATQTDVNPKRLLTKLKHHHKMPPPKT